MQAIRRQIRGFFAIQAILFLAIALVSLLKIKPPRIHTSRSLLLYYGVLALFLLLSVLFAMAWKTTRKPTPYRNPWAIAASLLSLVFGVGTLWIHRINHQSQSSGLIVVALAVAGLYFYAQGGAAPQPGSETAQSEPEPAAPQKPTRVAGDRTHPGVNYLVAAITVAAEFGAINFWSHWARAQGHADGGTLPWFVLFTAAVLIATVVHECGHAFFAWGCYMKLLSFNAGPFQWRKREGKWSFKFHPAGILELGGAVRVVPTNPKQPRAHEFWTIFAGPLANIVFGALLLWLLFSVGLPYYAETWRLVAFTASFCFIVAVTNLLPFMTEDGGYSDGARMLQIVTKSPLDDYHRTMHSLAATLVTQQRYRDIDIAALQRAAEQFPDGPRGLHLQLSIMSCYLDSDRLPEARTALTAAEAIYNNGSNGSNNGINGPLDLPAPLHTPFILGHACLNHDAPAARLWWNRMETKKIERKNVDYLLAQTALAWIEGRPQDAEEAWQKADAAAQKLPEFGAYDFDRDRCALLRKELNAPTPVAAPAATPRNPIPAAPAVAAPAVAASTAAARIAPPRRAPIDSPAPSAAPSTASPDLSPLDRILAASRRIPIEAPPPTDIYAAPIATADPIADRAPVPIPAPIPAPTPGPWTLSPGPYSSPPPTHVDTVDVSTPIATADPIADRAPAPIPAPTPGPWTLNPGPYSSPPPVPAPAEDPDRAAAWAALAALAPAPPPPPAPGPTLVIPLPRPEPEPAPQPVEDTRYDPLKALRESHALRGTG